MADGSIKIDVTVDDSGAAKSLADVGDAASDAGKGLDDLEDSAKNAEDGLGAVDIAAGELIAGGISTITSKLGEVIGSLVSLADETREYREDMAKLETAFTTAGHSTETANAAYDSFYRILGESDRTVEAVNHLAEFTKSEEELSQWSTICAGVTAKFGDSLPIEGLTEAANETAKVGQVTGPLADALNWAGISEDAFNEKLAACTSEQERASLITSTLNGEYAAAAEEYNKLTANTQAARDATNNMEQAQAALGAAIEPVTTAWTNMKAGALQWLADVGLPALQAGWQWVLDNIPTVAVIVGGLTAAWLAFGGAQTIVNGLTTAMTIAQTALNAVMNANPIGLVVLAITGLVAAFTYLLTHCEGFKEFWKVLWDNVLLIVEPIWETIKGIFTLAWEAIKVVWDVAGAYFGAIWDAISLVFSVAAQVLGAFFSAAWDAIAIVWDAVTGYFSALWESIKLVFSVVKTFFEGAFKTAWEAIKFIWDAVSGYFSALWDSIKLVFSVVKTFFEGAFKTAWEAITFIWDAVTGYFSAIWDSIKLVFSVVKDVLSGNWSDAWDAIMKIVDVWKDYFSGIWDGIKSVFSVVSTWFSDTFSAAWDAIKGVVDTWKSYFSGIWDGIKSVFSAVETWFSSTFSAAWEAIKGVFANWGSFFSGLWDSIKSTFTNLGTNIAEAIGGAVKSGINGVISLIEKTINGAIKLINGGIDLINLIPGVNVGKVGQLSLPRLAHGGVLEKGQVGLLEGSGAEAVVPLEKNTEWLDKIAKRLSAKLVGMSDGIVANLRATVNMENSHFSSLVTAVDTGLSDLTNAVRTQTAGINSLAHSYTSGGANSKPVVIELNGREFGRAVVDLGGKESARVGSRLVYGGAR